MKALIKLILLLTALTANAQTERPWEQMMAELLTADDIESEDWEDTYEMLCELEEQPLNLNIATREELESLPFLSAQQVEGIV